MSTRDDSAPNVLESVPTGQHQISAEKSPMEKADTNGAPKDAEKQAGGAIAAPADKPQHGGDNGDAEKKEHDTSKDEKKGGDKDEKKDEKKPAGGYDSTPVPKRAAGWTIKVTIHRASNLPMADVNSFSSDPYVVTQIDTETPTRHKEDGPLRMRTKTIRRCVDPEWNMAWTVANVPSSGCKLKMRLYDEDPGDHDDRLGNVKIHIDRLYEGWEGIKERGYKISKRSGSKRAYAIRAVSTCFKVAQDMHGELVVSVELLGRTQEDGQNGRLYTIGPSWWTRHYSPLLGRIANTQRSDADKDKDNQADKQKGEKGNTQMKRYDFQATQIQLAGPLPTELYHRFVEFKPWVQRMFTGSGLKGFFLAKALHHQHDRVYHFDRQTKWGSLPENPGMEMTKLFLDMVHYDQGARIFTYVLTLDALWRFTETGKEFGIDMLSKHTMHSDVGMYIGFSGEFFIRRLKYPKQPPPPEATEETSQSHPPEHKENPEHPPSDISGGPPTDDPPTDPAYYELVIDNDSGTYRPNAQMLPRLKDFLSRNLPGMHILTLDCTKDAEKMGKMKDEQRERKKREGEGIVYLQGDDNSSISSSDEEDLDRLAGAAQGRTEHGALKTTAKDLKLHNEARLDHAKRHYGGAKRHDGSDAADAVDGASQSK